MPPLNLNHEPQETARPPAADALCRARYPRPRPRPLPVRNACPQNAIRVPAGDANHPMPMKRLPSYDSRTSQAEHRLFLGLSLAAAALIAIAVVDASRFSDARQDIIAALSQPATTLAQSQVRSNSTNLAVLHPGQPEESARLRPSLRPKS